MMPNRRRGFKRPIGKRRYRKLFLVAVEGAVTEPQYFAMLSGQQSTVHVECLKERHGTSPPHVLDRMKNRLAQKNIKDSDEAWLVMDKDNWTDSQLLKLWTWACAAVNRGFALSNPNFEYWLLLHFDDGSGIKSSRDCSERLKRYLPDYNKGIDISKFTRQSIDKAITRAKSKDNPPCKDWPRKIGLTTVYKLVERIIR